MKRLSLLIRQTHLWLGLTCGVLASISGLTGSMYVWQPEITAALNPGLLQVDAVNAINEETLLKTSSVLYADHKETIAKLFLPYREQQTISIVYKNGSTRYYHPVSGARLGEKSTSIAFFEKLLTVHRTLGIPTIGKYIMGGSTVLFFIFLLTSGVILWQKKYKSNFRKGLKIKWKARKKRLNYDIHKTLGIVFFVPLLLIAFSGAYFTYGSYYKGLFKFVNTSVANKEVEVKAEGVIYLDINELWSSPDKAYSLRAIYFPRDSNDMYQLRYIKDRNITPGLRKSKEIKLNRQQKVVNITTFETDLLNEQIAAQMYPLHTGEITGVLGRVLVFITGFIPIILFITGARFYYFKKIKGINRSSATIK